jgi:hypothetical protein
MCTDQPGWRFASKGAGEGSPDWEDCLVCVNDAQMPEPTETGLRIPRHDRDCSDAFACLFPGCLSLRAGVRVVSVSFTVRDNRGALVDPSSTVVVAVERVELLHYFLLDNPGMQA